MLLTVVFSILCAYGAVMAAWTLFGRWLGIPLTANRAGWLAEVYKGVSDDGRDSGGCYTGGRLR